MTKILSMVVLTAALVAGNSTAALADTGASSASSGSATWSARAWYGSSPEGTCHRSIVYYSGGWTYMFDQPTYRTIRLSPLSLLAANRNSGHEVDRFALQAQVVARESDGSTRAYYFGDQFEYRNAGDYTIGRSSAPKLENFGKPVVSVGWAVWVLDRSTMQYRWMGFYPARLKVTTEGYYDAYYSNGC